MAISSSTTSRHLHRHLRLCSTTPSPPPLTTVDPTVKHLIKSRRHSEVEPFLEARKGKPPSKLKYESHFASIIVSYAYANMLDHATRTFHQINGPDRSALSLNALLTSYVHANRHADVPDLFADLTKAHSIKPDSVSYGIIITALCRSGALEKAHAIVKTMEDNGLAITAVIYTPIVDAFYKKKMPEDADRVWKEMIAKGCVPDAAAYNVRAMYATNHGKPEQMVELMEEMEKAGVKPDIVTYNMMITCYCKNGRFLDAKSLFGSLRDKKVRANVATYRNLARFLCKNGDFDAAFKVCKEGIVKKKIPDFGPAKRLLEGLVENGKTKEAKWLAGELTEKFPACFMDAWKKVVEKLGLSDLVVEEPAKVAVEAA